eukprot:3747212-Rhodomonas_salina.1
MASRLISVRRCHSASSVTSVIMCSHDVPSLPSCVIIIIIIVIIIIAASLVLILCTACIARFDVHCAVMLNSVVAWHRCRHTARLQVVDRRRAAATRTLFRARRKGAALSFRR